MRETDPLRGKEDVSHRKQANRQWLWIIGYVATASQSMICTGLFTAIAGPTLQFLALNTNSTIDQVSNMFIGRSIGSLTGAIAYSAARAKYKDTRPFVEIGIFSCTLGLATFCTPFAHEVYILICIHIVGGFSSGYIITAMTSLYLTKWGEAESRPYIQLQFLMYAIGAFFAPIIAKPFLEMASQEGQPSTTCPGHTATTTIPNISTNELISVTSFSVVGDFQAVWWSYFIFGTYVFFVTILFFILAALKAEDKIAIHKDIPEEPQKEGSTKHNWMFLISVMMFNFFAIPCYYVYQEYIYAAAACSDLRMDATSASVLTSVFWGGFVLGRAFGVFTSKYIKPWNMVVVDIIGITSSIIAVNIWGERYATVIWIGTFVYGVFVATIQPSGISWCSQVIDMTGKYQFVFLTGGNIGNSITLRLAGKVFQMNPFSVMYLIAGLCVGSILCFISMNLFARRSKKAKKKVARDS